MSAVTRPTLILAATLLAGCGQESSDGNITIANDIPPDAELEVLPADESVATPTDELRNGAQNPEGNELTGNSQ